MLYTQAINFYGFSPVLLRLALCLCAILFFPLSAVQKVNWEEIEWQLLKSEHFDIYFPKGYNHLAEKTRGYAEAANIYLSQKLAHRLSMVTPIFIYPSHGHFQSTNIIPFAIDEGTGGFTERIKRRVVVPYLGSLDEYRHVVVHELVHAFQYDILLAGSIGNSFSLIQTGEPPLWFIEGMAEFFSLGWDASVDMQMRDAALTDTLPTLKMMTEYRVPNPFVFYKGGQSVMRYIADTYGEYKLGEILRDLRDLRGIEEAIKTNLGIPFEEFDRDWRRFIKRLYFPLAQKKYDNEDGPLITRHNDDESMINLHAAISPDGTKIAYITARGFYPVLLLRDLKEFKTAKDYSLKRPEDLSDFDTVLLTSSNNPTFFQLHLLTNRLSFTADGKKIFFSARSQGKDRLIVFDIEKRTIVKRIAPAVDMVMMPRISLDGKYAVFVGATLGVTDVYRIHLETGKTDKITDDNFSEKDPTLSADAKYIVYSSNKNNEGNLESATYHLFEKNLETHETRQLTHETGKQTSAQFYENKSNDKILFVSNHTGIQNIYILDRNTLEKKKLTDAAGGTLEAQVASDALAGTTTTRRVVYTQFREQGFDIALRDIEKEKEYFYETDSVVHTYKPFLLPAYDIPKKTATLSPYTTRISPDFLFFLLGYGAYNGGSYFAGMVAATGSDLTGNHSFSAVANFLTNGLGIFELNYAYLKKRVKMNWGLYRTTFAISPVNLIDLQSLNGLFWYPNYVGSVLKFGAYFGMNYPLTPFDSLLLRFNTARVEEAFIFDRSVPDARLQPNRFTNLYSVEYGFIHNNVLYSIIGPLKGWHFAYIGEQTFNVSGRDYVLNRNTVEARYYWNIYERYIFASRVYAATSNGPDARYFPWIIGGPFNLRSYEFWSLRGESAFFFNLEFRFPLLDALLFGFPAPWVLRGFSMVMFLDGGGVFDNPKLFKGYNTETNKLQDFLLAYGLGVRYILFPGLMIKIDWGTPWNLKTSKPIGDWQGAFSIGYEY